MFIYNFILFQAEDEKYQKFDDFTIVAQTGLKDLAIPRKFANLFGIYKTFLPDLSYLAPDCFHPSQKLQALCKILAHYVPKDVSPFPANIFITIKDASITGRYVTIYLN